MKARPKLKEYNTKGFNTAFEEITKDCFAIKVRNLFPNDRLPFNIHFPSFDEPRGQLELSTLLPRGEVYEQEFHDYLFGENVAEVYVSRGEEDSFHAYFNSHLQKLLQASDIPPEKKTLLLYDNAENIVKKAFRERPTRSTINMGQQLVSNFATHLSIDKITSKALFSLFSKDYHTFTHSVQVALLGMSFCKFLGWSTDEVTDFGLGALFHDIGKNSIDDEILNKPSKLEKEEFEMIKSHSLLGYQQLKDARIMSRDQLTVVLHHHEATDGSGYPDRLQGSDIHKFARVARIVDVFDALTTKRVYKDAMPPAKALRIMSDDMRSTFDISLLDAFTDFLQIREEPGKAVLSSQIEIDLGTPIQIQFKADGVRLKTLLVGMERGRYLILRLPGLMQAMNQLNKGWTIIGRYLHEGSVFGFKSTIISCIQYPMPLLFLHYPKSVERVNLRAESRVDSFIPAELKKDEQSWSGIILDLSAGGCKMVLKHSDQESLPELRVDDTITIHAPQLFGEEEPALLNGKVRNISMDQGKVFLGIQFAHMNEQTESRLRGRVEEILSLMK